MTLLTRRSARAAIAILIVLLMLGFAPHAAEADGHEGPTVVATGLDQPRDIAFNDRGELFISEAGSGGPDEVGFFAGSLQCSGLTGAVTRVDKAGNQRRVVEGLPSVADCVDGSGAAGPAGLIPRGRHTIFIQIGSTGTIDPNSGVAAAGVDQFGRLLRTRPNGTVIGPVADITSFEAATDTDGEGYDSNPTDVAAWGRNYVITDAGANAVHVISRSGRLIRTVEVPQEPCPGNPGNCFGDPTLDSVPTGIARGSGDIFYISTLSGVVADFSVDPPDIGFKPGNGKVFAFDARTGAIWPVVDDLFTAIDVAYDNRAGTIYVAEFLSGAVWAVDAESGDRSRVDTPGDLALPGGLAVDRNGNVYVSTFTAAPGMLGQVVRYDR
ncbi:MAG: ScyD/ScyE family protein [Actinomycetota bacterium]